MEGKYCVCWCWWLADGDGSGADIIMWEVCEVAEEESDATELELVLWKAEADVDEAEEVCCGWVKGGGRCCLDCLESIICLW